MAKIESCGFFIYRDEPSLSFLLMQHPTRWDLPKGHVDKGETDMECALRELWEETGIPEKCLEIDDAFRYEQHYTVVLKKFKHKPKRKKLTIFLARLTEPFFDIKVTEHDGCQWVAWDPPHDIQAKTINPLLQNVEEHWRGSSIS